MLKCPVNIKETDKFQAWLKTEDKELGDLLEKLNPELVAEDELIKLQERHMSFINLYNYDLAVNQKANYYICPEVKAAVNPGKCMLCKFGHMAFDCHWPYDCASEYCTHYHETEGDF